MTKRTSDKKIVRLAIHYAIQDRRAFLEAWENVTNGAKVRAETRAEIEMFQDYLRKHYK